MITHLTHHDYATATAAVAIAVYALIASVSTVLTPPQGPSLCLSLRLDLDFNLRRGRLPLPRSQRGAQPLNLINMRHVRKQRMRKFAYMQIQIKLSCVELNLNLNLLGCDLPVRQGSWS